jgi:Fe-S-cluster-containing dehydrogenase component
VSATPAPGDPDDAFTSALRAEPLRALDSRGRADVRALGKLRRHSVGAVIFHAAEPADTLFVVACGAVRLEGATENALGRAVRAGELFGHEALVPFAVRAGRAVALEAASVLELPVSVLKRVLVRAGFPELFAREEARARRIEWTTLLARTALGALPPEEIDALAAVLVEEPRERGDALDVTNAAWLVAGGLFEVRAPGNAGAAAASTVYAARGDFIGVSAVLPAGTDGATAVALGSALALSIPREALDRIATRHPAVLSALERALKARETKQRRTLEAAQRPATRHAADEMERLGSARSLLAIDLDRCTRCGHCTWACADSHGSARLERRGDKVMVTLKKADSVATTALLLPSACQHCREPACLEPCPTGAIRRDATGAVELDADLCTGCGACAKACPWEAVRMAPRPPSSNRGATATMSAEIAVKCDLCRGLDGPECVSACPTDAIFRLDPQRDVVEVRAAVGPSPEAARPDPRARKRSAWGFLLLALVPPFVALDRSLSGGPGEGPRLAAGVLGLVLVVLLASHAIVKRVSSVRRRARRALSRSGAVSTVAPFVSFHAASGVLAAACVLVHAGTTVRGGLLGALSLAFWGVAASGVLGALVYRFLPSRLSRIERTASLPEDEPKEREALIDRLHAAVSGANAAKKELVRRILAPYGAAWSGTLSLIASGRSLAEEEAALAGRVDRALGGRKSERLADIDGLVRTAVEMRAQRARRVQSTLLRAWLPIHLTGTALLLALLALHVVGALR